jgi:hypothetical protein
VRKWKKKKLAKLPKKKFKKAYVALDVAEALSQPVRGCTHPMKILVLLGEETANPILVCQGCTTIFPVTYVQAGDEEE